MTTGAGPPRAATDVVAWLRRLAADGTLDLPLPGAGATGARFRRLAELGATDLSLGRLAEAHTDAVAILAEAGRASDPGRLLGVWAAGGEHNRIAAEPTTSGWRLQGRRHYCSGASVLDEALVTAEHDGRPLLFVVDLAGDGVCVEPSTWRTAALSATATTSVSFRDAVVPADALVGDPGFYLDRPGFWSGSVGVAAVWAGGAAGIRATIRRVVPDDPHALAHLGGVETDCWAMEAALDAAAAAIDAEPDLLGEAAMVRALRVRLIVDQLCRDVLDRAARALGPAPLAEDAEHAQRVADLQLYLRQGHAERDLEAIGRHAVARDPKG